MKKALYVLVILAFAIAFKAKAQTWNRADTKSLMQRFKKNGFVKKIDTEKLEIYIESNKWSYLMDAQQKKTFINLCAQYMMYFNKIGIEGNKPETTIYDAQSGKKLAHYSVLGGAKIDA